MCMLLQQEQPEDYVIASGKRTLFVIAIAFDHAGLNVDEHVVIDPSLVRPAEAEHLVGDASKAQRVLG